MAVNPLKPAARPTNGTPPPPNCVKTAARLIVFNLALSFSFQVLFLIYGLFEEHDIAIAVRSGTWFVMKLLVFGVTLIVVRRILEGSSLARSVLNVVGVIAIVGSVIFELGGLFHPSSGILFIGAGVGLVTSFLLLVVIVQVNRSAANEWFRIMKMERNRSTVCSTASTPSSRRIRQGQDGAIQNSNDSTADYRLHYGKHFLDNSRLFVILGIFLLVLSLCLLAWFDPFSLFERKPGDIHSISVNGTTFDFAWCPPGTFMMGSPDYESGRFANEVRHQVTLTKGYWIGTTEVTQGQWKSLMNGESIAEIFIKAIHDQRQYDFSDGDGKKTYREFMEFNLDVDPRNYAGASGDNVPVHYVGWNEAARFCSVLTEHERSAGRLPDGYEYRLPTEAEWEYACRAGTRTALPNGKELFIIGKNNAPDLDSIAWYGGNSSRDYEGWGWLTDDWPEKQYPGRRAAPRIVAQKGPNNWGIYDTIGNVWEWTNDRYDSYSRNSVTNPSGGQVGEYRVIRGGAWDNPADRCRPACRSSATVGWRGRNLGFRIVLAPILFE